MKSCLGYNRTVMYFTIWNSKNTVCGCAKFILSNWTLLLIWKSNVSSIKSSVFLFLDVAFVFCVCSTIMQRIWKYFFRILELSIPQDIYSNHFTTFKIRTLWKTTLIVYKHNDRDEHKSILNFYNHIIQINLIY